MADGEVVGGSGEAGVRKVPEAVSYYERAWPKFQRAHGAALRLAAKFKAEEQRARGVEDYMCAFDWQPDRARENGIEDFAKAMIRVLVRSAERWFAPRGCHLSIDEDEVINRWVIVGDYGRVKGLANGFSPAAIWEGLEREYGGGVGEEAARRQAAAAISSYFGLARSQNIKRVGGAFELSTYLHSEEGIGLSRGRRRLNHNCAQSLWGLSEALMTWASWMAPAPIDVTCGIQALRNSRVLRGGGGDFLSRDTVGTRSLMFTFFHSKVVLRIEAQSGERLNEFLSTYGPAAAQVIE